MGYLVRRPRRAEAHKLVDLPMATHVFWWPTASHPGGRRRQMCRARSRSAETSETITKIAIRSYTLDLPSAGPPALWFDRKALVSLDMLHREQRRDPRNTGKRRQLVCVKPLVAREVGRSDA